MGCCSSTQISTVYMHTYKAIPHLSCTCYISTPYWQRAVHCRAAIWHLHHSLVALSDILPASLCLLIPSLVLWRWKLWFCIHCLAPTMKQLFGIQHAKELFHCWSQAMNASCASMSASCVEEIASIALPFWVKISLCCSDMLLATGTIIQQNYKLLQWLHLFFYSFLT